MLIEDTDEFVRAATIKSIAINTVYIYDTDKYAQVNNIFLFLNLLLKWLVLLIVTLLVIIF